MNFYSRTVRRVFPNGMEAYLLPRPGASVEVECYIRTGSVHEGEFAGYGVSHFLEHMLFQGCDGFPEQRAAAAIKELGGSVNACTGHEYTMVNVQAPARQLEKVIGIISSMVRTPELPEAKFALEKQVILRECDRTLDNVSHRLIDELLRTLFVAHPLRHPICGYPELVAKSSCDILRDYHRSRYTPERCFWVITGDFEIDDAVAFLENHTSSWERTSLYEPSFPEEPPPRSPRSGEILFPDPLSRIAFAVRLPDDTSLYDAAEVLFGALGLGASSHLVRKLELEEQLAVGIHANCFSLCGFGIGAVSASAVPGKVSRLEKRLREELEYVRRNGLPEASIEREKRQKYAELLRQTGDLRSIAANIGGAVLGGESPAECDRRIERFFELTANDVSKAAEKLLCENNFAIIRQLPQEGASGRRYCKKEKLELRRVASDLAIAPDDSAPLMRLSLAMPGGTIFERADGAGSSALCSNWLVAGSRRLSESAFWEKLESCGADLSVSSGLNSLCVSLSAPRRYFGRAVKLLGEVMASPRFGDAEFERERARMIENCRCSEQSPAEAAISRALAALFGDHPYGRNRNGNKEVLAKLTPDDVIRFYRSILCRERIFAVFGGDCSADEAETWRNMLFRDIPWVSEVPQLPREPIFPLSERMIEVDLPREQTAVVTALPGTRLGGIVDRRIDILQQCENGLSSNLFRRVREENALSYSVGMTMNGGFHRGSFVFYALTDEAGSVDARRLIREEIERLASGGVDESEFAPARESAAFEADSILDAKNSLTDTAALEMYYGAGPETLLSRGSELQSVKCEDFNKLLKELFSGALDHSVTAVAHGRGGRK